MGCGTHGREIDCRVVKVDWDRLRHEDQSSSWAAILCWLPAGEPQTHGGEGRGMTVFPQRITECPHVMQLVDYYNSISMIYVIISTISDCMMYEYTVYDYSKYVGRVTCSIIQGSTKTESTFRHNGHNSSVGYWTCGFWTVLVDTLAAAGWYWNYRNIRTWLNHFCSNLLPTHPGVGMDFL